MLRRSIIGLCVAQNAALTGKRTSNEHTKTKGNVSYVARSRKERVQGRRKARGRHIHHLAEAIRESTANCTDLRTLRMSQLADKIFSHGNEFITSATNITFIPDGNPATPEVAFCGRSRVGKTALLRALFKDRRSVGCSNTEKRKDAMSFFSVGGVFNIVETPGYGNTNIPFHMVLQHASLIRNFVRCRPSLKMLYYCIDVQPQYGLCVQDIDMLRFLSHEAPNFTIVLCKGDRLASKARAEGARSESLDETKSMISAQMIQQELVQHGIHHPVIVTSAFHLGGLDALRYDMVANCLHALPTEMLSITEARKLRQRLFSADELGVVMPIAMTPTQRDDEVSHWNLELAQEKLTRENEKMPQLLLSSLTHESETPLLEDSGIAADEEDTAGDDDSLMTSSDVVTLTVRSDVSEIAKLQEHSDALEDRDRFSKSLQKKLSNAEYLDFIKASSPWRNPFLWPKNVVPTRSLYRNTMRCPEDPENPYLTQPRFVARRMDMFFRRPSFKYRRSVAADKGTYQADASFKALASKPYTIPYFPDIVDVKMPLRPQHFVGIDAYFSSDEARSIGDAVAAMTQREMLNPLLSTSAIEDKALQSEVQRLETQRYDPPPKKLEGDKKQPPQIAFLRPKSQQ